MSEQRDYSETLHRNVDETSSDDVAFADWIFDSQNEQQSAAFKSTLFADVTGVFNARHGAQSAPSSLNSQFIRFADYFTRPMIFADLLPKPEPINPEPVVMQEETPAQIIEPVAVIWPPVSRFADIAALSYAQFKAQGLSRFMAEPVIEMPVPEIYVPEIISVILPEVVQIEVAAPEVTDTVPDLAPQILEEQILEQTSPEAVEQIVIEVQPAQTPVQHIVTPDLVQAVAKQIVQAVAGQIVEAVTGQLAQNVSAQTKDMPAKEIPAKEISVEVSAAPTTTSSSLKPRGTLSLKSKTLTLPKSAEDVAKSTFVKGVDFQKDKDIFTRKSLTTSRSFSKLSRRSSIEELSQAFRTELEILEQNKARAALDPDAPSPDEQERKPHPLAKKSWAELLAELDRPPEKIKPDFDLAAAFKAELESLLAKQDTAATAVKKPVSRKAEPHRTRILAA